LRRLLRPVVLSLLRRGEHEIGERAAQFAISGSAGRDLVRDLGAAFILGYNTMLAAASLDEVARVGRAVAVHFRPFFFEGAAMGYLPRGYHAADCRPARAEAILLDLDSRYRYLYYVGLGFWYGFRHPRRPARMRGLVSQLDPLLAPLCYDGFGFKLGFFDFEGDPRTARLLERCPEPGRSCAYQGFGRSMFFVYMDDERGFQALRGALPEVRRGDLEFGRSLACGFTGVDRPNALVEHVLGAPDPRDREARLLGITWALAARKMNDERYFYECLSRAAPARRSWLARLPELCEAARGDALGYADWQARTQRAVLAAWEATRPVDPCA